ncbi:MAG: CBS domain-containing protein [Candidatus Xenobium sp.]|jgi:CBS domain-containing protein|nr:CBS domain-containing protein [Burkholderiales bacterium]
MTVREIMSAPVLTVGLGATVSEIADKLQKNRVSGLIVVDEAGLMVGVVGEGDLLYQVARPHLPPHIEVLGSIFYLQTPGRIEKLMRRITGTVARDIMSTKVVSVTEDTLIEDVASLMIERKVRRIPVVSEGRPVGIVTRGDVVRSALAGAIGQGEKEEDAPAQSQDINGVSSSVD